jgi:hypothetical protein
MLSGRELTDVAEEHADSIFIFVPSRWAQHTTPKLYIHVEDYPELYRIFFHQFEILKSITYSMASPIHQTITKYLKRIYFIGCEAQVTLRAKMQVNCFHKRVNEIVKKQNIYIEVSNDNTK